MKAVVFAAGIGSRLKPYTDYMPKALVDVGGVPVLARALAAVVAAGADAVAVNVHHFAPVITAWLETVDFGVPVYVSDESDLLLDTAGGIAKIVRDMPLFTRDELLLHNADIVHDMDLSRMLADHKATGADVTLLVDGARASTRAFLIDASGRMRGWHDTAKGLVKGFEAPFAKAFGGIHIISPEVAAQIAVDVPPGVPAGITPYYIDHCASLDIRAYTPAEDYRWHDIGTPTKLEAARQSF